MYYWSGNSNIHILPQAMGRKINIQPMVMIRWGVRHLKLHTQTQKHTETHTHKHTHKKWSLAIGWLCGKCWGYYALGIRRAEVGWGDLSFFCLWIGLQLIPIFIDLIYWLNKIVQTTLICFNKCFSFFSQL